MHLLVQEDRFDIGRETEGFIAGLRHAGAVAGDVG